MISGNAVYFDGATSFPHPLYLQFDERNEEFHFDLPVLSVLNLKLRHFKIEKKGAILELHLVDMPNQYIRVSEQQFINELQAYRKDRGYISLYQQFVSFGLAVYLVLGILAVALAVGGYLYIVPWVADKSVSLIPVDFENSLGAKFYEEYCKQNTVDSSISLILNEFAQEIDFGNSKTLNFTVIESETINAFALPDGNVVVFTGLLSQMGSYEELVALLSHEVAHVNHRHSIKMLSRNLAGFIVISVFFGDISGVMAIIAENAQNLQSLSYSRQYEREADNSGLQIMISNKVDPQGMIRLFEHLKDKNSDLVPEFLSTHPLTDARLADVKELLPKNAFIYVKNEQLASKFKALKK